MNSKQFLSLGLLVFTGCDPVVPKQPAKRLVTTTQVMTIRTEPLCGSRTTPYTAEEWEIIKQWPVGMRWECPGDVNCDGQVNFDDISPFVEALVGPVTVCWAKRPGCRYLNADCNSDCKVDFDDINPFTKLLAEGRVYGNRDWQPIFE